MQHDYWVQFRHGTLRFLAVMLVAFVTFAILPARDADAASDTFVFEGGGWGHSVGMSQYGALGMAQQGATWQEILTHYFTGVTPATASPELSAVPVWVNLTMESPSITLRVREVAPGSTGAVFGIGSNSIPVAPGQQVTVVRLSNGGCRLDGPTGSFTADCFVDAQWDGWVDSPTTAIEIGGCSLVNWNAPGGSVSQPCTYSRGSLYLRPDNNTNTLNSTLKIDVEDYLLGISEMPYGWANIGGAAALQAQVVAARSYVYARARWRGAPENRPWCWCQVYDTHYDQNYVGWGHGTQEWIDAVRSTENQVLTHPSVTANGQLAPIETFYSSSTFGFTENSENSFTATVPYLRSVDDHWSQLPSVGNPHATWTKQISAGSLAALLPGMTTVTGAEITECSATGAALRITFHGSGGPKTLHTRSLRGTLSLRSQQIVTVSGPNGTTTCEPSVSAPTTTTTVAPTTTTVPPTTTTTTIAPTTTTVPPTTTTTTVAPQQRAACPVDSISIDHLLASHRVLRPGTAGEDVRDVQRLLQALARYDGALDGIYGQRTGAAVRSFQDSRGLSVDGLVGSRTRGELAGLLDAAEHRRVLTSDGRLLKRGVTGDVVRALQAALAALGFDPGPVDGQFGSRTTDAVLVFQRSENLLADGIVGIQSRAALTEKLGLFTPCD